MDYRQQNSSIIRSRLVSEEVYYTIGRFSHSRREQKINKLEDYAWKEKNRKNNRKIWNQNRHSLSKEMWHKKCRKPLRETAFGTPEGARTPDPVLRRHVLYPTELLARMYYMIIVYSQGRQYAVWFFIKYYSYCSFVYNSGFPSAPKIGVIPLPRPPSR